MIKKLKRHIITEAHIQEQVADPEGAIEFSLSGDLVPLEIVEGLFLEFMKKEKNLQENFEARVVGVVWGLAHNTNFNIKYFNNKFNEIRKEHWIKKERLSK